MAESTEDTLTLRLVQHGETTVTVDRAEYVEAKAAGELDHFLDPYASDMETVTTVAEPGGVAFNPFG